MIDKRIKNMIDNYVNNGWNPGDFLTAVLANDLMASFSRADKNNISNMLHIVRYVYNHVPMGACGSYQKVKEWIDNIQKIKQELENDERMGVIF